MPPLAGGGSANDRLQPATPTTPVNAGDAAGYEIYIHVPFCMRRCGYCDFNTYTATDMGAGASRGNYANMVVREMRLVRDWQLVHGIEEPPVSTVFFGGGTPTILPARDLVMMLNRRRRSPPRRIPTRSTSAISARSRKEGSPACHSACSQSCRMC